MLKHLFNQLLLKFSFYPLLATFFISFFFLDQPVVFAQLQVLEPSDAGISLVSNSSYTVKWRRGGTTFNRVRIKLSVDGGLTFPYLLVNNTPSTATDSSEAIVVPGIPTSLARIRVTNQADSTVGDVSDNNFSITGYCWPWGVSCTNNFIRSVRLNTINNTTNNCSPRGYVVRPATGANTTTLYRGPSYSFTVKTSKTNLMGLGIWCDLNNDQDFDDEGEFLYGATSLDTTFNGTLSIPVSATEGAKRLRIRTVNGILLGSTNSCTFFPNGGEIEDYTVTIGAVLSPGPLVVRYPSAPGITLSSNGTATATAVWSKGATTFDRVRIKMSVDGGLTYPYLLVDNTPSTPTDTTENFVIPGIPTNQARIRIANQADSTEGDVSDNNFSITGYCWPWGMTCTNNFIRSVRLNTINNTTNSCSPRGYVLRPATGSNTTLLYRGPAYPFTVKTSKTNLMGLGIWCDLNNDLDFDDAGEFLYGSSSLDTTFTGTISIPNSVTAGAKRLRIRTVNGTILSASDACSFFPNGGEIEDFTITVGAVLSGGPLIVRYPSDPGITLNTNGTATATARWSKGGTIYDRVQIKLSIDGGETFPYLLVNNTPNIPTDTTENFVIPGLPTTEARIRIANQADSTDGDISENNFTISGYCWPWGVVCTNNFIRNVRLNTLNNTTNTCSARGYINHPATGLNTTTLYRGSSYSFTVKTSKTNMMGLGIWCDLNNDLDFDDPGEFLFGSSGLDTTFTGSITLPVTASQGAKRIRFRTVQNQLLTASDACTFFSGKNGEIEDFTITAGIVLVGGPLVVRYPSAEGISLASNGTATATARWSKGGTTFDRVQIKLSVDGGSTYPYLLVNNTPSIPTDTTENFVIPGIPTTQAKIRIANQNDSTESAVSENNFSITGYCWPWGMSCTNGFIRQFDVNTISRSSACASTRGYVLVAPTGSSTTTLLTTQTYPFTLKTSKTFTNHGAGIWCDFNNDQDFDDPGEFLYGSSTLDTTFNGSITIPNETIFGARRFRVRIVQGHLLTAADACKFFNTPGEIEDYTVTIDIPAGVGPLVVRTPSNSGISLVSNANYNVTWSKGATTFPTVNIKLSADGGATYPYTLASNVSNSATLNSSTIVVPGIITNQARIRVANSADSTQGDVSDNNFAITGYCWPWASNCTGNFISQVSFNSLLRNSTCGNTRGYVNVAPTGANTTSVQRGLSYPFSITTSNSSMAVGIWCDFNGDFDFDDAGEFLFGSTTFASVHSGTLTIPQNIATGDRRFRVRTLRNVLLGAGDACSFNTAGGEIEDYTITITQPTITMTTVLTEICAGTGLDIAFTTTGTFLPGNEFQVQLSAPGGSFLSGVSVIGRGVASPVASVIPLGTVAGTYRIRIVSSTPLPAVFGFNSPTFSVLPKPSTLVATGAQRCGPGSVTLTSSGCTDIRWFDSPQLGTQVGTGPSFVTPSLTASTTYYVTCFNVNGCQAIRTPVIATIRPLPSITSFSPTSAVVEEDFVTIEGSGFNNIDSVRFGVGRKAFVASSTATQIVARVPAGAVAGPISVFTQCGNATSSGSFSPIVPVIQAPVISLASGTYPSATSTTLSCETDGALIYYTLDGSIPVVGSPQTRLYNDAPIFIGTSLTLRAIGFRNGWATSPVASATYTITTPTRAAMPVITPPTGSYVGGQYVSISTTTPGATIWYTTNGQTPQPGVNNPTRYQGPFTRIDPFVSIKAIAVADGYFTSLIATSNLTISGGTALSACTFSPVPGVYSGPQTVTISNPDPAATIYYTLDGTDPFIYSPLSRLYTGPVLISSSATLKAQAYRPGFGDSPRTTGIYTIGGGRINTDAKIYFTEEVGSGQSEVAFTFAGSQSFATVFPNPTSGDLTIGLGEASLEGEVIIYNLLGKIVQKQSVAEGMQDIKVSLSGHPAGMYLIRYVDVSGNAFERKVVLK